MPFCYFLLEAKAVRDAGVFGFNAWHISEGTNPVFKRVFARDKVRFEACKVRHVNSRKDRNKRETLLFINNDVVRGLAFHVDFLSFR
jgi:hypothetical protein